MAQHAEQKNSFVRTHAYLNAHKTAQAKAITDLIQQIKKENPAHLPILLKLSPDSSDKLIEEMVVIGKEQPQVDKELIITQV